MRNLKKVLTLVLTLAMLLSVMVVGAGAATFGDQESITNKEAVDVCTTLNIIGGYEDGTFRPAGNVTRAEMSKMICVALNGGQEPTMGSNLIATFNDVASTDWSAPYIEYCVSQGIVGGVGGGNFNPTGNITGTQAAKMLLCILGYNASIQGYVGSDYWETNINVDAAQKGLYTGLSNIDASVPLTRDQAAQMIWNALNAYEVEYKTTLVAGPDGTLTSKVTVQDKIGNESLKTKITLLEDKYEAKTFIGDFDGNSNIITALKDGEIQVTGTGEYLGKTAQFSADLDLSYIGEEVKVLYKDNRTEGTQNRPDSKDVIYGIYVTGTTTVYNITKGDLQDCATLGKIKFNDTEYKVSSAAVPASTDAATETIVINYGSDVKTVHATVPANGDYTTFKAAFNSLKANSADTVKFIVKDGEIVKAYVQNSKFGKISSLTSSKIAIEGVGTKDLEDCNVYSGANVGDLVKVTEMFGSSERVNVVEKANTVTGKITSFKSSDSQVQIDGTWYTYGANTATATDYTSSALTSADIGSEVVLLVDGDYYFAYNKITNFNNYAIVTKGNTEFGDTRVQLFMRDGNTINSTLDDGTLDGGNDGAAANAELFAYDLKSDNTKVDLSSTDRVVTGAYSAEYNGDNRTLKVSATQTLIVDADAAVFVYVDKWKAYTAKDLGSFTATSNPVSYILDGNKVVAFAVKMGSFPTGGSSSTGYGYVTERVDTEVGDNKVVALTVWNGGEEPVTVNVDGRTCGAYVGDFIEYPIVSDGALVNNSDIKVDGGALTTDDIKVQRFDDKVLIATTDTISAAGTVVRGDDTSYTLTADTKYIGVNTDKHAGSTSNSLVKYTTTYNDDYNNAVVVYEAKTSNGLTYKEVKAVFIDEGGKLIHYTNGTKGSATGPVTTYAVTAPSAITEMDGLSATVIADKTYARNGETITYTVTVTGTASTNRTLTMTAGTNSTASGTATVVSGDGWTGTSATAANLAFTSGRGVGVLKFTVTANGGGDVGAASFAFS